MKRRLLYRLGMLDLFLLTVSVLLYYGGEVVWGSSLSITALQISNDGAIGAIIFGLGFILLLGAYFLLDIAR